MDTQNKIKTDVCIVGAGPSGAATSIMLSKLKIKHVIIDKAVFPRDKTCGDGLILYAYKALKELDEELFQKFLNHPKVLHSESMKLHISDEHYIHFREAADRGSLITYARRIDFDNFLVKQLDDTYATKLLGNEVRKVELEKDGVFIQLKNKNQIKAKIVVGADGIQSVVSRKLANNKIPKAEMSTFINAYFSGVTSLSKDFDAEIRLHYKKIPLFFYIFPLIDGQVNVSLGGNTAGIQKHNINLKEVLQEILENHPKVKDRFVNAKREGNWRGWGIPYDFYKKPLSGERYMLVGDASGLANPFYKEGVGTGMMSGIICAKKIRECMEADNFSSQFLKAYDESLKEEFGKVLKFSKLSLVFSRYRRLFSLVTNLFKPYVERRTPAIVKRRSY